MKFLEYIIMIVFYIGIGFFFYKMVTLLATIKKNKLSRFFVYLGIFYIPTMIVYSSDVVNVGYTMIGFILLMLFCFEGDHIKNLSVVMILYPIVVSVNYVSNHIASTIYISFGETEFISLLAYIIELSIKLGTWFTIYEISKIKLKNINRFITKPIWLLIDMICIAPLISIIVTIINTPMGNEVESYPIAFACIATNFGMPFLMEYIIKSVKTDLENQNLKLEYSYYKELEDNQLEIRKLRHDMNNHLSVIYSFLENNDIPKAKDYFTSLSSKFTVHNREFCKNSIVNAVINSKYNLAVDNNIDCFFNIDIKDLLPILDIDLCCIFANALDNSIEACKRIDNISNRKLSVQARSHKGYFTYNITNTFIDKVTVSKGKYISHKEDKKLHGFGIENIKNVVEKYNGTLDITYTDSEFSVLILIKL